MCNEAARRIALDQLREDWGETGVPLRFPEGLPNMAPLDSVRITDPSVIIRAAAEPETAELVTRRWSWPGMDAPKRATKSKRAFTVAGLEWFCIAGLWRADPQVGEAWTMLTCPPGPDIEPYHGRQVVVLGREAWARWLDPAVPSAELCRPAPAGTLVAEQVR